MLAWLSQNWGTLVVVAVILALTVAIVVSRVRAKRAGKGGCGCGCEQCAMRGNCHPSAPENKK